MLDETLTLALETIMCKKQALIFVPSRASAEKTAEDISKQTKIYLLEQSEQVLKGVSAPTKQCKRLAKCVKKGIAFHHAGLITKQKTLIEDEFRAGNIKVICCTPTLCLSGDTSIWQPTGNTLVKNFGNSQLFALSQNNKLGVMKAKKVNKNRNSQKLIKITSSSGYSIKLTPNHQILLKRGTKKQLFFASECKKKDKIATVGKLNLDKITKPKISNFIIENSMPISDRELTEDDFYFIGSMLGDGHSDVETRKRDIKYKGSPTFTSGDIESIELIEKISKSFDQFSKGVKRKGSISLVLTKKKWFREFLCRSGIEMGINKYISPLLMQADLKLISGLLRGLFDTGGCVERSKKISFSNISFKLIKNIQKLLLRFGIVSYLKRKPAGVMRITEKEYQTKESFELIISQNRCIFIFSELIGFSLKRKQKSLEKVIKKISHILYSECRSCGYKIYSDVFSGRSNQHKIWGEKKRKVIELLGKEGELGSRVIHKKLGFLPRHSTGNRLNHHYELITKRRMGSRSNAKWFWNLDLIGSWIYWRVFKRKKELSEFFKLTECPICKNKLNKKLRKKWRDSDFDGDIFWDYVRNVEEVEVEEDVYDVVLPDKPINNHMFVANGFIVHNSAGMSLPAFRVIIKSLKRYSGRWGMNWIPVLEYHQMAGRAGRPEYEKFGEAITIAKTDGERDEIHEKYVCGSPEEIYSKLAVEPVFRTYLLSLIATGITNTKKKLVEFFSKTFWAYQFKDMNKIRMMIDDMLKLLEEYEFIKINDVGNINLDSEKSEKGMLGFTTANNLDQGKKTEENIFLKPTMIGKRVSELYLDPFTANHLIKCLKNCYDEKIQVNSFSFLQMISNTLEMVPPLRVKVREQDWVQEKLVERYDQLLEVEPSLYDHNYEDFINSIKTSLFFESWISEDGEDYLMEQYGVRPGEIFVKLAIADWLLYSSSELVRLMQFQPLLKEITKLRVRVKNGVREELLALLKLKGVGRKRARKLFKNGIKDLGDVKKAELSDLVKILGSRLAVDVKGQLGEEVKEIPKGRRKGQMSLEKY